VTGLWDRYAGRLCFAGLITACILPGLLWSAPASSQIDPIPHCNTTVGPPQWRVGGGVGR
jgi:hypothetical protein